VLSERGLAAALDALVLRSPVAVELTPVPRASLPDQVEAAAYYVVAEALANAQKHAAATRVTVAATVDDGQLRIEIADEGAGGADPDGEGLRGLRDRVATLGGTLDVDSPAGRGTSVRARLPVT